MDNTPKLFYGATLLKTEDGFYTIFACHFDATNNDEASGKTVRLAREKYPTGMVCGHVTNEIPLEQVRAFLNKWARS